MICGCQQENRNKDGETHRQDLQMICGSCLSHAYSPSLSWTLVRRSSVDLVCAISPSLSYVEMRSTDHMWILSVCFSVLIAIFLSTSTDHLWILTKKHHRLNPSVTKMLDRHRWISSVTKFLAIRTENHHIRDPQIICGYRLYTQ